jgi:hypothetical protein
MRISVALATLLLASAAGAQGEIVRGVRRNALVIEAELVGGYTPVELEKWARARVTTSDHTSYGVNLRAFLFFIGDTRVGVEVGNQHFFRWESHNQFGSTVIKDVNDVAGYRFGIVVQVCDEIRYDCDMGYSFHFIGRDVLPGGHLGVNYLLLNRRRVSLPVGARLDVILGDQATALPVAFKTGITIKT